VATHRCPWRSAWTPSPRSSWTVVLPARRPHRRDLQDRGRRQPGPAARRARHARHARILPARRHRHHHPCGLARAAGGAGTLRRGGRGRRAGNPVQRPSGGPTRRPGTTPNSTPTPPRAWRCPPSGVTCCGVTAAGRATATSTNSSRCPGSARYSTPAAWRACWTGGFGHGQGLRALAYPGRGPPHQGPAPTPSGPTTAARQGYARWWSSRSVIWPTPGRYAPGGAGSTASGTSSALPQRWSASAGGCTESPHDRAWRTPSMPSGCATCSRAACRRRLAGVRLDVTTWPRCDAESTCRSVLAVNAPTSGTRHGGAWHDAWPAELLDPQAGVEGSYAGWLGAQLPTLYL